MKSNIKILSLFICMLFNVTSTISVNKQSIKNNNSFYESYSYKSTRQNYNPEIRKEIYLVFKSSHRAAEIMIEKSKPFRPESAIIFAKNVVFKTYNIDSETLQSILIEGNKNQWQQDISYLAVNMIVYKANLENRLLSPEETQNFLSSGYKFISKNDVTQNEIFDAELNFDLNNLTDLYITEAGISIFVNNFSDATRKLEIAINTESNKHIPSYEKLGLCIGLLGVCSYKLGLYDKALKCYKEALDIAKILGQKEQIASELNCLGLVYEAKGKYKEAIKYFNESLKITKEQRPYAARLINVGLVYSSIHNYDKAINYFNNALEIGNSINDLDIIGKAYSCIGGYYQNIGEFDKSILNYEKALSIGKKLSQKEDILSNLSNIAGVYREWGQNIKALQNYEEALAIAKMFKFKRDIAGCLNNIGGIYHNLKNYDYALKYYKDALNLDNELKNEVSRAQTLSNIASIYFERDDFYTAYKYFDEASSIFIENGDTLGLAVMLNNFASIYYIWGDYEKTLESYKGALAYFERKGMDPDIANCLNNIGAHYHREGQYIKAIKYLTQSVNLIEKLRRKAIDNARRDYLAKQIDSYQFLISSYIKSGDVHGAFKTIELSRAKLLKEKLIGSEVLIEIPTIYQIQEIISEDVAILVYANVNWSEKVLILITKNNLVHFELSDFNIISGSSPKAGGLHNI